MLLVKVTKYTLTEEFTYGTTLVMEIFCYGYSVVNNSAQKQYFQ